MFTLESYKKFSIFSFFSRCLSLLSENPLPPPFAEFQFLPSHRRSISLPTLPPFHAAFPFPIANLLSLPRHRSPLPFNSIFSLPPSRRPAQPPIEGLETLFSRVLCVEFGFSCDFVPPLSLFAILFSLPWMWWVCVCVAGCGGFVFG